MMKKIGLVGALLLAASFAQAATINLTPTGLTGWSLSGDTTGEGNTLALVTTLGPGWGAAIGGTAWIAPNANQGNPPRNSGSFAGSDVYATTFDLTGFLTSGVSLNFNFMADDSLNVYLNSTNNSAIYTYNVGCACSAPIASGSINLSGLNSGINTLYFVVSSIGGPTGLDLTGTVTASPAAVPEPATYAMMIAGLGAVAAFKRYRRS